MTYSQPRGSLAMLNPITSSLRIAVILYITAVGFSGEAHGSTYSCDVFARMTGIHLPRSLPCIDPDDQLYYKSFSLYCEAKSLQSDIKQLMGCEEKYFERRRSIYGD